MYKLSITDVIFYEFEENRYYTLKEISNKFSKYYNIDIEEFTFIGYSYSEVVDIIKDNNIGKIEDKNFLLLKKDIWEMFLNIFEKIELNNKIEKLSKDKYQKIFNKNIKIVSETLIKGGGNKSSVAINVDILQKILNEIFYNSGYMYNDGGKENLENFLKRYSDGYNKEKNKFIINIINIENIIKNLYKHIEISKEVYYSIKDVEKRLKYPANLENYYTDKPWIYHIENEWIKYSTSRIQEIIKKDYEGESEFFKFGNWRIYGSDEQYKDEKGKHKIPVERSLEIRPGGHDVNKGRLQYLMNSTYCRYLLIELENRILHLNYKYSLSDLENKIGMLSNKKILTYLSEILTEINNQYVDGINNIIRSNNIKIQNYKNIIERIKKYRETNNIRKLEGYKELKTAINKLEKIRYQPPKDTILTNIKIILEENNKDYVKKISKKIYNKQIRNTKNLEKILNKSYEIQRECISILSIIKKNLKQQRKILNKDKLFMFDLYFNDILE